jgi:hypothetical protein
MANQIIPQEDFNNIVSLFESKEIENIQLGICLVRGQKCYRQFKSYFGKTFTAYVDYFNRVVSTVANDPKIVYILDSAITANSDMSKLWPGDICYILANHS